MLIIYQHDVRWNKTQAEVDAKISKISTAAKSIQLYMWALTRLTHVLDRFSDPEIGLTIVLIRNHTTWWFKGHSYDHCEKSGNATSLSLPSWWMYGIET